MSESKENAKAEGSDRRGGPDWSDPTIPCGNSPPMARWPMVLAGAAWMVWIGFLVAMLVLAFRTAT